MTVSGQAPVTYGYDDANRRTTPTLPQRGDGDWRGRPMSRRASFACSGLSGPSGRLTAGTVRSRAGEAIRSTGQLLLDCRSAWSAARRCRPITRHIFTRCPTSPVKLPTDSKLYLYGDDLMQLNDYTKAIIDILRRVY